MNREKRARLLRTRFRAIGGLPYPPVLKQRPAEPQKSRTRTRLGLPFFAVSIHGRWQPQWIREPDPPIKHSLGIKLKARVSPLAKIAAHVSKKLRRMGVS
jgi:hypothetical protein